MNAVLEILFWNRDVERVRSLLSNQVPGLLAQAQPSVGPYEDGRLVRADGRPMEGRYAVAGSSLRFFGTRVAEAAKADLYLWRLDPPARLAQLIRSLPPPGGVGMRTEIRAYACRRGRLRLELVALEPLQAQLRRNGVPYRELRLAAGERWVGQIPARPRRPLGRRLCSFGVLSRGPLEVAHADFER